MNEKEKFRHIFEKKKGERRQNMGAGEQGGGGKGYG